MHLFFIALLNLYCLNSFRLRPGSLPYSRRNEIKMVFDFFRQRADEGIQQVKNIAAKTLDGKFGEAIQDSFDYIKERNKIDAENFKLLTKGLTLSRDRLLKGIFDSFGDENIDVKDRLLKFEDVLLQAGKYFHGFCITSSNHSSF